MHVCFCRSSQVWACSGQSISTSCSSVREQGQRERWSQQPPGELHHNSAHTAQVVCNITFIQTLQCNLNEMFVEDSKSFFIFTSKILNINWLNVAQEQKFSLCHYFHSLNVSCCFVLFLGVVITFSNNSYNGHKIKYLNIRKQKKTHEGDNQTHSMSPKWTSVWENGTSHRGSRYCLEIRSRKNHLFLQRKRTERFGAAQPLPTWIWLRICEDSWRLRDGGF